MSKFRSPPQPDQSGSEEQDLQQPGTEYPQQPQYPPQFPQQPQYSPFQQPMQPPPKPKRRFFRSPLGIGCGVLAALIVLVIIIVAIASTASGGSSNTPATNPTPAGQSTQAASQQNTPATKPTSKPQSTHTSITHGIPQIGGPISNFYGKYGQPTTMNGGWVLDQQQNTIVFADADASGNVTKVTLTTVADWNMATTKQHCIPFLPSDAQQFNDAGNFIDYHSSVGEVVMLLYAGSCVLTIAQP